MDIGSKCVDGSWVAWTRCDRCGNPVASPVPAVVRRSGPRRVQIEVRTREPYTRTPRWEACVKWVAPCTLSPRLFPSAAFAEPMLIDLKGFRLTGWKHSARGHALYPNGVWYGAVNGYVCTAPASSEENSVRDAWYALNEGGYRVSLLSAIEVREHWMSTGQDQDGKGEAELPELRRRLAELDAAFPEKAALASAMGATGMTDIQTV